MAARRLRVEEWQPIRLDGEDGLTGLELEGLLAEWMNVSGTSPEGFFYFASRSVSVRNWSGTLRSPEVELQVLPRGGLSLKPEDLAILDANLNHMLATALLGTLKSDLIATSGEGQRWDAVVKALADATMSALRHFRPREYRIREETAPAIRGRIEPVRTELLRLRRPGMTHSRWVELTEDVAGPRFIKSVLLLARSRLSYGTRRYIEPVLAELEGVSDSSSPWVELSRLSKGRQSASWEMPIRIATDLLDGRVGGLFSGMAMGESEVLYLPDLFERYFASVALQFLADERTDVRVQEERSPGVWSHGPFSGIAHGGMFRTDIELWDIPTGVVVGIVDTKWKKLEPTRASLGITSDDLQQMISYAQLARCSDVALLYPWMSGRSPFLSSPVLEIGGAVRTRIHAFCLPLLAEDIRSATLNLVDLIRGNLSIQHDLELNDAS